ncbi:MAG: outer membrane beta-barrel protein [Chthoniobacterales bacterium]
MLSTVANKIDWKSGFAVQECPRLADYSNVFPNGTGAILFDERHGTDLTNYRRNNMKKLTLTLCMLTALVSAAYAGTETYSGKEMKQVQTPCPQWYADNEWNIGISAVYAARVNGSDDAFFLNDDAWGVAGDFKYFFHRYFGLGVQGFGLAASTTDFNRNGFEFRGNSEWISGVVGTFTLRYPIQCSRWSPYAWWGFGGVWGGGDVDVFARGQRIGTLSGSSDARLMGQYGLGFEVRITNHFGWTLDGSYNQVDGSHNDFWMARTGLNFAF